ncbi:hypothetical protein K504DRAFT_245095 [Pleomassaria siparia CBS 279.74]|uniref:Uncharacterized protein n=1 Tax=Pleomassaria siparia CBS 279.74 TaxID=1314801 RepID=A0A6G1KFT4_9PLEO|nr:hypothetical protein K504DRAFT_245095 [Pleomassaria siparia CBS 279.74]
MTGKHDPPTPSSRGCDGSSREALSCSLRTPLSGPPPPPLRTGLDSQSRSIRPVVGGLLSCTSCTSCTSCPAETVRTGATFTCKDDDSSHDLHQFKRHGRFKIHQSIERVAWLSDGLDGIARGALRYAMCIWRIAVPACLPARHVLLALPRIQRQLPPRGWWR